jgi:transposase
MTLPWEELLRTSRPVMRQSIEGIFNGLINRFTQQIKGRDAAIEARDAEIARLQFELRLREEQLRLEKVGKYGPKSEKLSAAQLQLLDVEPGVQAEEVAKEAALPEADKQLDASAEASQEGKAEREKSKNKRYHIKAHVGRTPLPAHLERKECIIPCQEAANGKLIGYVIKEELVIKPAEAYVQVIKREERVIEVAGRRTILTAPAPGRIVEKGQLSNSTVVELLVSKYCDHLPIYRQMKIWQRDHGIKLNEAQPLRAVMSAGKLLQPLAKLIGEQLKAGGIIQADETRVPVLQQDGKGRNDTAWFWQYSRPGGMVYFDYQESRSRAGPSQYLKDYSGRLQSDGYEVYTPLGKGLQSHAGCWAHVRRKFDKASKVAPQGAPCTQSAQMLGSIAALYAVEAEAREQGLQGQARLALRQQRAVEAQLSAIKERLLEIRQKPSVLPASQLGKACDYALGEWEKLTVYAKDGEMEIDNNWCENEMRPIALGRKNWMHLGCQESGPVVAAIMSVMASAQRAGHNLRDYLSDVLGQLCERTFTTSSLPGLLPDRWKNNQRRC